MNEKEENWIWLGIEKLKVDGNNPNKMSNDELEALKRNIQRFGWNMPIIVNKDYLIADGEQKLQAAKELQLKKVPVLIKDITEAERMLIRQSMNKLRGKHNPDLDALEFKKILKDTDMEELVNLTGITEQNILNTIEANELGSNDDTQKVSKLGSHVITCPACGNKFELKDKKDKN